MRPGPSLGCEGHIFHPFPENLGAGCLVRATCVLSYIDLLLLSGYSSTIRKSCLPDFLSPLSHNKEHGMTRSVLVVSLLGQHKKQI